MQNKNQGGDVIMWDFSPEELIAKDHVADRQWDIHVARERLLLAWGKCAAGVIGVAFCGTVAVLSAQEAGESPEKRAGYVFSFTQAALAAGAGLMIQRACKERLAAKTELSGAKAGLSAAEDHLRTFGPD
jgi:hypothetical protein